MTSHSSSLLSELKDIATEAAEREKSQPTQGLTSSITPQPRNLNTGSSKFTLSDALADVHGLVDEEARAEKKRRVQTQELARAAEEAKRTAEEERYQAEISSRVAAEEARRLALAEDKRLKQLRADYEAALARGESVEMPAELRPPEPTPAPQAFAPPQEPIVAPPPPNHKPLIFGGVAAVVVAVVLVYALLPEPKPEPKPVLSVVTQPVKPEKSEADRIKEQIAAQLAAEQKRKAEEEAEKKRLLAAAKRKSKKRATKKKKKKKKPSIQLNMDGF